MGLPMSSDMDVWEGRRTEDSHRLGEWGRERRSRGLRKRRCRGGTTCCDTNIGAVTRPWGHFGPFLQRMGSLIGPPKGCWPQEPWDNDLLGWGEMVFEGDGIPTDLEGSNRGIFSAGGAFSPSANGNNTSSAANLHPITDMMLSHQGLNVR